MSTAGGYSGTPLPRKLGIGPGATVVVSRGPEGFDDTLDPLPDGVRLRSRLTGRADLVILFAPRRAGLKERLKRARRIIPDEGAIWIAWPKKSSGISTDLGDPVVREIGLAADLVDNKVCAIDETWSALRFVVRVRDRGGRSASP